MKIFLTLEASEQADECDSWWRENRPATPGLFAQELAAAQQLLLLAPRIGPVYTQIDGLPVRRVLMKKTKAHVTTCTKVLTAPSRYLRSGALPSSLTAAGSEMHVSVRLASRRR